MNRRIDLSKETSIPLSEVPRHVPKRRGKKVHYSTVYRWATKGTRGRKLETVMSGGIRYTTLESIERFLHTSIDRTPALPESDLAAVQAALDAAGL
ncbi:DUF1580 domain-containing protein [Novipirellula artificiosorum]|uniref:DUF1580 domain-containing protein n=1 Tax=Novipirellula artificiosorum TaxID=2528016 RepID=A0A5C6DIY2_9BACT|nr:DUF1580 domain-containing protein [Novipirellula artificiosorum]TWU34876.1 hypothetical protein Poly41_40190 [Novipirellula artificiosorum]